MGFFSHTGCREDITFVQKTLKYNYRVSLKDIQTFHTVSYDDDRVPHIDAIDSVAQALQLTFLWREQACTCLFRRMRKMKPIDWFHAIQQTRLQLGLGKASSS